MDTITRKIDKLGRVVLPSDYRKALNLNKNTKIALYIENGSIMIRHAESTCKLCGSDNITFENGIRICKACINKIKNL